MNKKQRSQSSVARPNRTGLNPGDQASPNTAGSGEAICPECRGTGQANNGACRHCGGTGKIIAGIGGA